MDVMVVMNHAQHGHSIPIQGVTYVYKNNTYVFCPTFLSASFVFVSNLKFLFISSKKDMQKSQNPLHMYLIFILNENILLQIFCMFGRVSRVICDTNFFLPFAQY